MTRLAWVVAALLVLSGSIATPTRATESARLVTSCAWYRGDDARPENLCKARVALQSGRTVVAFRGSPDALDRSVRLPHQLFQRPPPSA